MGKKKNRRRVSRNKFKDSICLNSCNFCSRASKPIFCYKFFKKDKSRFKNYILRNINVHEDFLEKIVLASNKSIEASTSAVKIFEQIFCDSNMCKGCDKNKDDVLFCIDKLKSQYNGDKSITQRKNKNNEAKVAIIISDSEEFQAEVKRILESNN